MTDLGPEARELLDLARDADGPTAAGKERNRAALVARLGAPAMGAIVPGAATAVIGATWTWKTALLTAFFACGVAVTGAMVASREPSRSESTSTPAVASASAIVTTITEPVVTAAPKTEAIEPPPLASAPAPSVAPPPRAVVASSPSAAADAAPELTKPSAAAAPSIASAAPTSSHATSDLAAEVALLGRAQSMLRSGHPELALSAVEEHERAFPKGALAEERRGVRILALCALGRREGNDEARGFLNDKGSSPLAARIRGACPK